MYLSQSVHSNVRHDGYRIPTCRVRQWPKAILQPPHLHVGNGSMSCAAILAPSDYERWLDTTDPLLPIRGRTVKFEGLADRCKQCAIPIFQSFANRGESRPHQRKKGYS